MRANGHAADAASIVIDANATHSARARVVHMRRVAV